MMKTATPIGSIVRHVVQSSVGWLRVCEGHGRNFHQQLTLAWNLSDEPRNGPFTSSTIGYALPMRGACVWTIPTARMLRMNGTSLPLMETVLGSIRLHGRLVDTHRIVRSRKANRIDRLANIANMRIVRRTGNPLGSYGLCRRRCHLSLHRCDSHP